MAVTPRVGIVTGLQAERDLVAREIARANADIATVRCDGPGAGKAEAAARALIAQGVRALASIGVAGGLKPSLEAGTAIVARHIVAPPGAQDSHETDPDWRRALIQRLLGDDEVMAGDICGAAEPVVSAVDKAALAAATGAEIVDMESAAVARVAAEAGVPFMALRVVADTAARSVPAAMIDTVAPDGRVRAGRAAFAIMIRPWVWPAAVALSADWRAARRGLSRVLATAGPALAAPVALHEL